jgi:hypothetical protein
LAAVVAPLAVAVAEGDATGADDGAVLAVDVAVAVGFAPGELSPPGTTALAPPTPDVAPPEHPATKRAAAKRQARQW